MRRSVLVGVVIALVAGCSASTRDEPPADNTAAICRETLAVLGRYEGGDAPEFRPYLKAVEDSFQGREATEASRQAVADYWTAMARDLRPIPDRATKPELRKALREMVDGIERKAAEDDDEPGGGVGAIVRVSNLCAEHRDR